MEDNFWIYILIAVVVYVLWGRFQQWRDNSRSKKTKLNSRIQPALQRKANIEKVGTSIPQPSILKQKTWEISPEEVFRKEYVSFTRIKTFKTCPRMFELIYLYKLEQKKGRAAQVGSLIHEILRLYTMRYKNDLANQLQEGDASEELLNFYDQAISSIELTHSITKSELQSCLNNFVLLNRKNKSKIQSIEYECNSTIDIYNLKCIIDRVDMVTGSPFDQTIIDYKTGNPRNVTKNQLHVYAYALGNCKWIPLQLVIQFLKNGEISIWEYTPRLHSEIEQWLLGSVKEINCTKEFRRISSRLCDYCGVSQHCYTVPS